RVAVGVLVLVEVQSAAQLLQIDHVRQLRSGEAQNAEGPARGGVTTHGECGDLEGDVGATAHVEQVLDLSAHDIVATVGAVQYGLVDDRPQAWGVRLREPLLSTDTHVHTRVDVLVGTGRVGQLDHRACVVRRLQEAGDELDLEGTDDRRGLLQPHVHAEPLRQHVAVLVPPALGIGAGDEPEEGVALLGVIDSVQLEQVVDVALFEADLAEFHAADLGVGGTDLVTGVVTGNALLLAKAPELGPEENTQHGRAAAGLGEKVLGDLQILRVIGDHDASLWLLLAGTTAQYIHEGPRWAGDGRSFLVILCSCSSRRHRVCSWANSSARAYQLGHFVL